jgi:hypothetical protein
MRTGQRSAAVVLERKQDAPWTRGYTSRAPRMERDQQHVPKEIVGGDSVRQSDLLMLVVVSSYV